ncbi:MAG: acetoin utilization protein AcuC [Actinobacteria bacterium]|nr:MAG: acetoin utilization protein AcuC [Actinomycetota bacterium]
MSDRVALVWDDAFEAYDFGPQHPLKPIRVVLTVALVRACGLDALPNVSAVIPRSATRAELETIHDPAYIDAVERISREVADPYGNYGWGIGTGDDPAFAGMHDASARVAGASITAADAVWSNTVEHAFNPAGGLHHAMADHASGFCIYNDPAIAIRWLLDHGAARVAYIDVDVHHGDGVQAAFYVDPRVLTVSLHESGHFLFPGTGFPDEVGRGGAEGTKVNVSLPPYTYDDAYRAAFERVVPPLVEAFKPDVLVTQLGCDTHATDPLAHFALTTKTYRYLARALHDLAHSTAGGKWVATGGGGYQIYAVVPRAWTIYFAELAGGSTPTELPAEWVERARAEGARELPDSFDDHGVILPRGRREEVDERAAAAAQETVARVFPYFGLR